MWYRMVCNSVINYNHCQKVRMDVIDLFTTFRAIEKRRHQTHKRRRAIIFSRFSHNIHNIMAMAIQYTSNGLSTNLVVHQSNLYQPFVSSNPPFNTMETSSTHAQLLSYPDLPQSSCAMPGSTVIATVLAWHGFDRVYTSNFNRTIPCQAVPYRAGTEKLCLVNGVLQN